MSEEGYPAPTEQFTPVELATLLKRWRIEHGLSQKEAAIALRCSKCIIRRIEGYRHNVQDISLAELLYRLRRPVNVNGAREAARGMPLISRDEFGRRLREWRKRHRFSRTRAARALRAFGFPTVDRTIWTWETGRELPWNTKAVLDAIAKAPPEEKPVITRGEFATLFKLWRKAHGLNQMQASTLLGVGRDQAKISKWESGIWFPMRRTLERLLPILKGDVEP